jgi:pyruvate dehydrogenase E2 component (dihydrolipoamide acetyltransferase)
MSQTIEIRVPDIGDFKDVPVIEVLIKPGDHVNKEDPLIALESEKATMEVPSPSEGTVVAVSVKIGDKVSQGSAILTLANDAPVPAAPAAPQPETAASVPVKAGGGGSVAASSAVAGGAGPGGTAEGGVPIGGASVNGAGEGASDGASVESVLAGGERGAAVGEATNGHVHASPAIRRLAREFGVRLERVHGSGPHGRIIKEDVQAFVKGALADAPGAPGAAPFAGIAPWPKIDFAQYGPIEIEPLSRIKKIAGPLLQRNWVTIPHVTNHDDADITELEAFRLQLNAENAKAGVKLTLLAFLIVASVAALRKFPEFNSSLDGESLVLKRYYNIGFAADTPGGLVVPVVKNADAKGLLAIAAETGELAAKARAGKLGPADMAGGTFTISSLGGIGGTSFTPIVNAPEVAILGVSRAAMRPVWDGSAFAPRLSLPLSLSWDHRAVDGAAAARFVGTIATLLGDMRRTLL